MFQGNAGYTGQGDPGPGEQQLTGGGTAVTDRQSSTAALELGASELLSAATCPHPTLRGPGGASMPQTGPKSLVHNFQAANSSKKPGLKSAGSQF